jgi:hypothetical protein
VSSCFALFSSQCWQLGSPCIVSVQQADLRISAEGTASPGA